MTHKYKELFDKTSQAVIFVDAQFKVCDFNEAASHSFGETLSYQTYINNFSNIMYVGNIEKSVLKELKKKGYWKGKVTSFSENQKISLFVGEYHRISATTDDEPHYILLFQSIDENSELIASMIAQQRQYETFFEVLSIGLVVQTQTGDIVLCNSAAEQILGLTKNQMLGISSIDPSWRCIHEDGSDFPGHTHPVPVCLETGKPIRDVVMGVYRPNNMISWIAINAEPIFDRSSKKPISVICSFREIPDFKEMKFFN
jgi:PAS domain S-box-containing protein